MAEPLTPAVAVAAFLPAELASGLFVPTAAKSGGAFPPFDPATFAPQLVWLVLTFSVLYWLLSRIALPKIAGVIAERRDRIERDLSEAQRLKAETDAALKAYEQSLADARGRAQTLAKETRERVQADLDRDRQKSDQENARRVADMERQIAADKARALQSVNEIATETAAAIVGRLVGRDATADEIRQALAAVKR